jgi:iron complex outermembrane receptor protein
MRASQISRDFQNLSWSLGVNHNFEKVTLKANVGKSFRMPIPKELAANGVNYHHFSYEVGDALLSPEIAYQADFGVELNRKKFAIGVTPFINYFSNYIYLNPSSEHDRLYGNGNQIFYYEESEVIRFGGEIHSHYDLMENIEFGFIGEYVYSEQLSGNKKGFTLPFSPPASALINIKYTPVVNRKFKNPYFSIDYKVVAPQNNIVPPEEKTDGYQVVNTSMGGQLQFGKQEISIAFQVKNLFNQKFFNHTSYYRLINVPEAGRNFILNINIPF